VSSSSSSPSSSSSSSLLSAVASRLQIQPRQGIWKKRTTIPTPQLPGPRKLSKLALQKAKDWKGRVERLSRALCQLELQYSVADVLQGWPEQLAPTDLCFVVKTVGHSHWQRALELYEWLNMRHWYTPNPRMLATILGVLGRSNQPALAQEIFSRAEPELGNCVQVRRSSCVVVFFSLFTELLARCNKALLLLRLLLLTIRVLILQSHDKCACAAWEMASSSSADNQGLQVYNAIMSVHARHGRWNKVQPLLVSMREKGCEPDLITFNIIANARTKEAGGIREGMATTLLREIHAAGLQPDAVTYNTLISACSANQSFEEARAIFQEMKERGCDPDIWTYNTMISVCGRSGMDKIAEDVFQELKMKGFIPDAITFNSILFAYARNKRVEEVEQVLQQMEFVRCRADEITYNTIIDMYGNVGLHEKALSVYHRMKDEGCVPDAVTYTVLIDVLGKGGLVLEAEQVFAEMVESSNVNPTLHTFSAMICGYAKAGMYSKAARAYAYLLRVGIQPDLLLYSVMLDLFHKAGEVEKAIATFKAMVNAGLQPSLLTHGVILQLYREQGMMKELLELTASVLQSGFDPALLCSTFVKAGLWEEAGKTLKMAMATQQGDIPPHVLPQLVQSVLNTYAASAR
jgi:pentatricopeptide repeat protein